MPDRPNLSRADAARRSATVQVGSYVVDIDLTEGAGRSSEKTFGTTSTIRFSATPGESTFVEFVGAELTSATLNGADLDVLTWTPAGGLVLPELAADNELVVRAVGDYSHTGEGLHRFVDPVDGAVYLYTQFETADAKRMFACFDQPDLKAEFTFTVLAPDGWVVLTNGPDVTTEPGTGGATLHRFAPTVRMSTYVTALIAGEYHGVTSEHDGIPLGLYCRKTLAQYLDADVLFTQTQQGFDFFHQAFGVRYPFGKYDQIMVPEFNAGAMENAGAVTFREEYLFRSRVSRAAFERRCETVLHEMAHMWFGDLVTMRWWDDLWLNESFATWASMVAMVNATEYTSGWTTFANVEKSWAYVQDQLPSTHPIAADMVDLAAVEVNFDGITYAKGASVLKQLAAYVGYEPFLAGLHEYFNAHAFGNAELADLLGALSAASGRDLSGWSGEWLTTTGLNGISAEFTISEDGTFESFALVQTGAEPGAGELRRHRIAVGLYDDDGSGTLRRAHRAELDLVGDRVEVDELIGLPRPALVLVNDDDLTYCKARFDSESLATAVTRISDVEESLPRTLIWSSVWEMTRDALTPARDFLALGLRGLPAEEEAGVLQRVTSQLQVAVNSYAEPTWAQQTGWPTLSAGLLRIAREAEPGSDLQFVIASALTGCRLGEDELTAIAGWLDGSAPLPGLAVDTEMIWTLLGGLVAHGWRDEDDIAAAAADDATASGDRKAAQLRALIPTPENKQAVFDRLLHDESMTNAFQDSALAGFSHPAQLELMAPFADQYFDQLADVWAVRSSEMARRLATGLFPRWSVDQATIDQALAFEAQDNPAALKRLVSEGRAGLERALKARAADAAADSTG